MKTKISRRTKLLLQCTTLLIATAAAIYLLPSSTERGTSTSTKIVSKASGVLESFLPTQTANGITLIPIVGSAEIIAITMEGDIVQRWPLDAERARLLPNGNLLTITGSKWGHTRAPWKDLRDTVREYTWDGEVVWEYRADDVLHHDLQRLANGNTLLLKRSFVPQHIREGLIDPERRNVPIRADTVIEVTPDKNIVHSWRAHEHLDVNYCGVRKCAEFELGESSDFLDWTHINTATVVPENPWFSQGDLRFTPGNLIVLPRNWWHILIIDKNSGKEVWRYRGDYRGGISGGHEAQMIPPGLPGAGNILVLDNGTRTHKGESIILEINPANKEVVWTYENGRQFYTKSRGSVQRLSNGNTLISEDRSGRIFEVTPTGKIVWSYKVNFPINRAQRYPMEYCPTCSAP